jgi:hypothetical protein
MAGPRISELYKYMTLPQAAEHLGMHAAKLRRRLRDGIFPDGLIVIVDWICQKMLPDVHIPWMVDRGMAHHQTCE